MLSWKKVVAVAFLLILASAASADSTDEVFDYADSFGSSSTDTAGTTFQAKGGSVVFKEVGLAEGVWFDGDLHADELLICKGKPENGSVTVEEFCSDPIRNASRDDYSWDEPVWDFKDFEAESNSTNYTFISRGHEATGDLIDEENEELRFVTGTEFTNDAQGSVPYSFTYVKTNSVFTDPNINSLQANPEGFYIDLEANVTPDGSVIDSVYVEVYENGDNLRYGNKSLKEREFDIFRTDNVFNADPLTKDYDVVLYAEASDGNISKKRYNNVVVTADEWTGAGAGTESDPYKIEYCEQFRYPASMNASYVLDRGLDCTVTQDYNDGKGIEPWGSESNPFTGKFDGQGNFITNLTINRDSQNNVALFSAVANNAVIENIDFRDPDIIGRTRHIALIADQMLGQRIYDVGWYKRNYYWDLDNEVRSGHLSYDGTVELKHHLRLTCEGGVNPSQDECIKPKLEYVEAGATGYLKNQDAASQFCQELGGSGGNILEKRDITDSNDSLQSWWYDGREWDKYPDDNLSEGDGFEDDIGGGAYGEEVYRASCSGVDWERKFNDTAFEPSEKPAVRNIDITNALVRAADKDTADFEAHDSFGLVAANLRNGEIVNVTIKDSKVDGIQSSGLFVGKMFNGSLEHITSENNKVRAVGDEGFKEKAGIAAGTMSGGYITHLKSLDDRISTRVEGGGIVGVMSGGEISNSYTRRLEFTDWFARTCDLGSLTGKMTGGELKDSFSQRVNFNGAHCGDYQDSDGAVGDVSGDAIVKNIYSVHSKTVGTYSNESGAIITDSYWNKEKARESGDSEAGTALTIDQMQNLDEIASWDFEEEWDMRSGENSDYPVIRGFYDSFYSAPHINNWAVPTDVDIGESFSSSFDLKYAELSDVSIEWYKNGSQFDSGAESTTASFSETGYYPFKVQVWDGEVLTERDTTIHVNCLSKENCEDINTEFNITNPQEGDTKNLPPVYYTFNLNANDGQVTLYGKKDDGNYTYLASESHNRGEQAHSFEVEGIEGGNRTYYIEYERNNDSKKINSSKVSWVLEGYPDSDNDGVRDSNDECPETYGELDNGCPNTPPDIVSITAPDNVSPNTEFSVAVDTTDPDGALDDPLTYSWNNGGEGRDTVYQYSTAGNKTVSVTVDDGIDRVKGETYVTVEEKDYPEEAVDIDTSFYKHSPEESESLTETPVNFSFTLHANNGTFALYRETFSSVEQVEKMEHTKGNTTYNITEEDTPLGYNNWFIWYVRDADGASSRSNESTFYLDDITDSDSDNVRDRLDYCPYTPGSVAASGCPDPDGDGVANEDTEEGKDGLTIDQCPDTFGLKENGCTNTKPTIESFDVPSEVNETEKFSVSASASDLDSQSLSYTWINQDGDKLGQGGSTELSVKKDTSKIVLQVSDGIEQVERQQSITVNAVKEHETDIDTDIVLRNPEERKIIPDTPVTYRFNVTANDGDLFIMQQPYDQSEIPTPVKEYDHRRGSAVYRFDSESIEPGQYKWSVLYEREEDNLKVQEPFRSFELQGLQDSDGDGVPDSEDECQTDTDSTYYKEYGVKLEGAAKGCLNSPPEIQSFDAPDTVNEGENFTVNASATDQDAVHEDSELQYVWNKQEIGKDAVLCYDVYGYHDLTLEVSDNRTVTEKSKTLQVNKTGKECVEPSSKESDSYGSETATSTNYSQLNVSDDESLTPKTNITTEIDLREPEDNSYISTTIINYNVNVTANIGTVEVFQDGEKVASEKHGRGTEIHNLYNTNFTLGPHEYQVKYTREADGQEFYTNPYDFFVEDIPETSDFNSSTESSNDTDSTEETTDEYNETTDTYPEGDKVAFSTTIEDSSYGTVYFYFNGEAEDMQRKDTLDEETFTFYKRVTEVGNYTYHFEFQSDGGVNSSSQEEEIQVEDVDNLIEITPVPDIYDPDSPEHLINYTFNITAERGSNITLTQEGNTLFSHQKETVGETKYEVQGETNYYDTYFYEVELEAENATKTVDGSFKVKNETNLPHEEIEDVCNAKDDDGDGLIDEDCNEEICGDNFDNDGDGLVDEDCNEVCGNGVDDDGDGYVDENCGSDILRNITFSPKEFYVPEGQTETKELTIDSTLKDDTNVRLAVDNNTCPYIRFRGINEYTDRVRYTVPGGEEVYIPVNMSMPLSDKTQVSCDVSYVYNNTERQFQINITRNPSAITLDPVFEELSPLVGGFAQSFAFERCPAETPEEALRNEECEEPVTTQFNPAAALGLFILMMIGVGFGRNYYRTAYKGEPG